MDQLRTPPFDEEETAALSALGVSAHALARGARCPDPALVLAIDEGVLDADLAARVKAHVAACPACQLAAADLGRVFDEGVPAASRQRIDARLSSVRRPARGLWFWIPAGAAAAVAAVVIAVVALRPDVVLPIPEKQLASAQVVPPIPTVFRVDRPAVAAGEIDLTVRGEATVVSLANRIGGALDLADSGDIKTAVARLEAVVREHPRSRDALLALGATLLRDAQSATPAVAALERARAIAGGRTSDDEVDWYLAMALVRSGDRVRARVVLGPVCEHAGPRGAVACEGLRELARPPAPR